MGLAGKDGAPGKDGADGKDGKDGRDGSLEGVTVEKLGRVMTFRTADGRTLGSWTTNEVIYRGQFRDTTPYEPGDAVTYAGSLWIARETTRTRPGDGVETWALAVKRGDPGKGGPAGPRGPAGEQGRQGLPGVRY